jgi:hypothetical protein
MRLMHRWKHAHPAGWVVRFFVALNVAFAACALSRDLSDPPLTILFDKALIAIWGVLIWRYYTVGLAVGRRGIRLRTLLTTRIVAWQDIARFVVRPSERVLGRTDALWVHLNDWMAIEASVLRADPSYVFDKMVGSLRETLRS